MLHEEADSQRRLIDGMEELAGYYLVMRRELTQMRTFFDIPAPTTAASTSQTPPPPPPPPAPTPTDPSLPIDPPPPPAAVPTAETSTAEAPVDHTSAQPDMEQTQSEDSLPPASQPISVGDTPPLPDDSAEWAAFCRRV